MHPVSICVVALWATFSCLTGVLVTTVAYATPVGGDPDSILARAVPSPLLSIDQNRATVVDRVVGQWGDALIRSDAGIDAEQLRSLLTSMRADQLLAASLAGSLDGLRNVVATAIISESAVKPSLLQAKALGDGDQDVVYVPVTPCRLVETRGTFAAVYQGGGPFTSGEVRTYTLQGANGVCLTQLPAGITPSAVQMQVFGIPTSAGSGDIEIQPQGGTFGTTATLVYLGSIPFTSASATSLVNLANKQISVQVRGLGAHVAMDVVGYFRAPQGGYVSSVTAGAGLTGGTITGSGTIDLAATQLLPTIACGPNLIPKWIGGAWTCAADANSGGTVTNIATGTGLTGGPITGTGTISITNGGVGNTQLADGSVNVAKLDTASTDLRYFKQGGNAFGAQALIGTADNFALDVRANNARVMRYEPNAISPNVIGGHATNSVTAGVRGATIGGGGVAVGDTDPSFTGEGPNRVTDAYGTIGGGYGNRAGNDASGQVDAAFATVGGGHLNTAHSAYSTVGGGSGNTTSGSYATVAGGEDNTASAASFVGGGNGNEATQTSVVAGGVNNSATGVRAAVAGGENNEASGDRAVVAGGLSNHARGHYTTVAGGTANFASSAGTEIAATVGGGASNSANGNYSTITGGRFNYAFADYSWVGGHNGRSQVAHTGAFVWADDNTDIFSSAAANEFSVRATGGVRIVTAINGSGVPTAGVSLAPGDSAWGVVSDRAAKENWIDVDGREVLARLVAMPIGLWNYKAQSAGVKHVGPSAQDFRAAFGLGNGDKSIATVDADGVALAAIQGLNAKVEAQAEIIQRQRTELDALRRDVDELRAAM